MKVPLGEGEPGLDEVSPKGEGGGEGRARSSVYKQPLFLSLSRSLCISSIFVYAVCRPVCIHRGEGGQFVSACPGGTILKERCDV